MSSIKFITVFWNTKIVSFLYKQASFTKNVPQTMEVVAADK